MKQNIWKRLKDSWYLVPALVLFLGLYSLVSIHFPWNSDYVAITLVIKEMFKSRVYLSPDTFFIKYPVVMLISRYLGYGRLPMLLTQLIYFVIMAAGYFVFVSACWGKQTTKRDVVARALTLGYLVTISFMFYTYVTHPYLRNMEIGIVFGYLWARYFGKRTWVKYLLTVLLFLTLLSDTYFLFVMVVPLLLAEALVEFQKQKDVTLNGEMVKMVVMFGLVFVVRQVLNMTPYFTIIKETASFQTMSNMGNNSVIVIDGILKLVGADFGGREIFSIGAVMAVLSLGLFTLSVVGLVKMFVDGLKEQKVMWVFPILSLVVTLLSYLMSTNVWAEETTRYLVFLVFLLPLGLYYFWMTISPNKLFWLMVVGILLLSLLKAAGIYKEATKTDFWKNMFIPNALVEQLKKEGLTRGYSAFWNAGITTYASGGEIKIVPIICNSERALPYKWVSADGYYLPKEGRSFLIMDRVGKDKLYFKECGDQEIEKQFGKPEKIVELGERRIWVFKNDIADVL